MSQDDDHEQALEVAAATVHIDHTIEVRRARDFARTAVTAYLSAMPQRELLAEALDALEYIALITNRAPAISHEREIHISARAAADKIRAALDKGEQQP